jgi:hypothetical protein
LSLATGPLRGNLKFMAKRKKPNKSPQIRRKRSNKKKDEPKFLNPKDIALPPELEIAALKGDLVFFIGNGISRLYGLPSWDNLANKMIDLLAKEKLMTHSSAELLKTRNLKVKVSIADDYFKSFRSTNEKINYKNILHHTEEPKAYQDLVKCKAKFVTTNYDLLLYNAYSGKSQLGETVSNANIETTGATESAQSPEPVDVKIAQNPHDFTIVDFLENNIIWHLHGCVDRDADIIASTKDYLKLYSDPKIQEILEHIFSTQAVVFLGYGLDEIELLDVIVRTSKAGFNKDRGQSIFYVLPIYSYEFDIYKDLKSYYEKHLGIEIIPMCQDDHGYKAFEELINNWSGKISKIIRKPSRIQRTKTMDSLIAKVEG